MLKAPAAEPMLKGGQSGAIHYAEVDPASAAAAAAELLTLSFLPPCLCYSEPYMRWQLGFPGVVPSRVLFASHGLCPVGFVAATPRSIWMRDEGPTNAYLLSFLGIHPRHRHAGIGRSLLQRLVEAIPTPAFAYTVHGAPAERLLTASVQSRGWALRRVAELRTYMFMGVNHQMNSSTVARGATVDEFHAAVGACTTAGIAWSHPTREQVKHYAADPRGSCLAIVQGPGEITLGVALIVRSQILTARGTEMVPTLESVFLDSLHATAALAALGTFALSRWRDCAPVVTAPNLHTVPASAIRLAGFRATRSAFNLTVMGEAWDPIVRQTTTTNLEVV